MIGSDHPVEFLYPLLGKEDALFTLSKYIYTADSLLDERERMVISGKELTRTKVEQLIDSLRPDQELALHSEVVIGRRHFHIPMIDFSTATLPNDLFERMLRYLPKSIILNMAMYKSGRSFHAYSTTLLGKKDWYSFMGRLLLINQVGCAQIVDTRWVGHRLIGGFGSLRWSNNSGQHLGLPSRTRFI